LRDIRDLQKEVEAICGGKPAPPRFDPRHIAAVVKWVDGSLIDTVHTVA